MLWTGPPNLDCLACRVSFLQVEEKGLITSWGGYVFPPISRFSLFLTPNLVSASSHLRYCKDELSILLQVQGCVESSYVTGWEIVADTVSFRLSCGSRKYECLFSTGAGAQKPKAGKSLGEYLFSVLS